MFNLKPKVILDNVIVIVVGIGGTVLVVALVFLGVYFYEAHAYRFIIDGHYNSIDDKRYQIMLMDKGQSMVQNGSKYYAYKKGWYIVFDDNSDDVYLYLDEGNTIKDNTYKIDTLRSQYNLTLVNAQEEMPSDMYEHYAYLREHTIPFKGQGIW